MLIWDRHRRQTSWRHRCAAADRNRILLKTCLPEVAALVILLLTACSHQTDSTRAVDSLRSRGKTAEALRLAEKALSQRRSRDDIYWALALRKTQLLETLNRRAEAVDWLRQNPPARDISSALATLLIREHAAIESALGRFRDADQHLLQAIALASATNQARMTANLQVRRAYVLIQLDRVDEAEQCLANAARFTRNSHDQSLDSYILHYQGLALVARNEFEEAIVPLTRALTAARQAKQGALTAERMNTLAWCYFRLGQLDKSLVLYREALDLADPDDRHLILGHLGNVFYEQHKPAEAAA